MTTRKIRYNLARSRQVAVIRDKTPREIRKGEWPTPISSVANDPALACVIASHYDDSPSDD